MSRCSPSLISSVSCACPRCFPAWSAYDNGPPVTVYALRTRHMTSLRWQASGGLDFEARPKPRVCRNHRRSRECRQLADVGLDLKSRPPKACQRRLVIGPAPRAYMVTGGPLITVAPLGRARVLVCGRGFVSVDARSVPAPVEATFMV
jgi:hypothetical protein